MPVTGVSRGKISPGRRVAFEALRAVGQGAYASDVLRCLTRRLESRDAGLASQIVFGCLRSQAQLRYLIFLYSGRKPESLDDAVVIALRAAIYQLRYLERVPAHAAVNESVELVRRHKPAAGGLVNAVLRKVNRKPVIWPDLETEVSCPLWLIERWTDHFGFDRARGIAEAGLREPIAYIRVAPGSRPPENAELESTPVEGCFRLLSARKPGLRLHDISSQAVLPLLDLQPGQRYLDLCAAPGNKTLQALETPLSLAIACDISSKRIGEIPPVCQRVVLDATRPLPFSLNFDRIFIDAPCSGTGTLARNPEIKWRVRPDDFARFGEKQRQIIWQALERLEPGGKLLYATCSLESEENEEVVRGVLASRPGLRCEREVWRLPGREEGDGFYAAVLEGVGE